MVTKNQKREIIFTILFSIVVLVLTTMLVYRQTFIGKADYAKHMVHAMNINFAQKRIPSYPIWHFGVWACYKLFANFTKYAIHYACAFFTGVANAALYLCITYELKNFKVKFAEFIALALMFVSSICLPWYNPGVYPRAGSPTTWHNPTNLVVKPFAILAFILIVRMCETIRKKEKIALKEYIKLTIVAFLSVMAKPSFFQGIVPALGIYILVCLFIDKWKTFKQYFFICLSFVPAFLVIISQFFLNFYSEESSGEGLCFGWSPQNGDLSIIWGFFLSLAFPLLYFALNFKRYAKEPVFHISITYAVICWCEKAFIYEGGARRSHGNLSWAALLSYTVLWVVTTGHFFKDLQDNGYWEMLKSKDSVVSKIKNKDTLLLFVWALHLISGIYYFCRLMVLAKTGVSF